MNIDPPGFDLVPIEQRDIVRARIAAFDACEAHRIQHGRDGPYVARAAAGLGIGREQFYYLSKLWKKFRDPTHLLTRLPGRGVPQKLELPDRQATDGHAGLRTERHFRKDDGAQRIATARRLRQARRRAGHADRHSANVRYGWKAWDYQKHESACAAIGPQTLAAYAQAYGVTVGQLLGTVPMALDPTIGQTLFELVRRSAATQGVLTAAGGWMAIESFRRYVQPGFDPDVLSVSAGEKLVMALAGRGTPPITRDEIMILCERHPSTPKDVLVANSARPRTVVAGERTRPTDDIDILRLPPAAQATLMTVYRSLLIASEATIGA